MTHLLDTGILLRLLDEADSLHETVESAVNRLIVRGERLLTTTQNIAEFWSVATRPKTENGLGFEPVEVNSFVNGAIDVICTAIPEHTQHLAELKRLLLVYRVRGKQVHDARLVASMLTWKVDRILTLNERHFLRFAVEGIVVESPRNVVQGGG